VARRSSRPYAPLCPSKARDLIFKSRLSWPFGLPESRLVRWSQDARTSKTQGQGGPHAQSNQGDRRRACHRGSRRGRCRRRGGVDGRHEARRPGSDRVRRREAPGSSGPSGQPAGSKAASAKAASAKVVAQPGPGAFTAAVAGELHVGTARAESALRPLLAAGMTDSSSREFAAAASSLSVTPQQLFAALAQAKQSLTGGK
jgi:hypothetical protein